MAERTTHPAQAAETSAKEPAVSTDAPALAALVGALCHGLIAAVYAWPIAGTGPAVGAWLGAAFGALGGWLVGRSRIRLWLLLPIALAGGLAARAAHHGIAGSAAIATSLGPAQTLQLAEILQLSLLAITMAFVLRVASTRARFLLMLEAAYGSLAFVLLVVAHRNGAIHRPFALSDPLLQRGLDPTLGLLLVGGVAVAALVTLVLRERHMGRWLLHGALLLGALVVLLALAAVSGVMNPPIDDDALGLLGDGEDERRDGQRGGASGASDGMEFQDDYNNDQQRYPVGVVLFHDDYSPPNGVYYFRQGAFSQYNGRRLVAATRGDVDTDVASGFPLAPTRVETVEPQPWARRKIETTVALLTDHIRPIGLEAPIELRPSQNPDPRRFRRIYRVWSAATDLDYGMLVGAPVGDAAWSAEQQAHYQLAPDDPRYEALAKQIVAEVLPEPLQNDPVAQAFAIQSWLSQRGTYSLKSKHAGADDPTAHFLFGDLVGYCVHFAHASTFLMRSLGLPARVATGYAVDESARQGGSALLISGQTSHAWPEMYVDGIGWLIVDVSPAQALSGAPPPPDPELQRLLAELARGERPLPFDGPEPPKLEELGSGTLAVLGWGTGALLLVLVALLYLAKLWRAVSPYFASKDSAARLSYRAALDRLSDLSARRLPGETPTAFFRRMERLSPTFGELTERHLRSAYGAQASRSAPGDAAALSKVHRELRNAFPWWRRLLGALAPWSWLLSR